MKALLVALLLAGPAIASETDGGHAPAERWTHPRGPASGSARTTARPPRSFGKIRWTLPAKAGFLAPPVTWDGVAFLVDGKAKNKTAQLLAIDTDNGKLLARTTITSAGWPRPAVHRRSVFLLEAGQRLVEYTYKGKTLRRGWEFDGGAGASPARILNGEIYFPTRDGLLRLRPGSKKPVWTAKGRFLGAPAVFRDHVYAVTEADGKFGLAALRRSDGGLAASCLIGPLEKPALIRVVVGDNIAAVRLAKTKWAIIELDPKKPALKLNRTETMFRQPIAGRMLLSLNKAGWCIFRTKGKRTTHCFVQRKDRPDLVAGTASPIVLAGHRICFGTWLGDLQTNKIFWHLNERPDRTTFAKGLFWAAVPAGHERLLVVPAGGKALHCIESEEIG